jgi:hypothetical protein
VRDPCQARDHHAEGHPAGAPHPWRAQLNAPRVLKPHTVAAASAILAGSLFHPCWKHRCLLTPPFERTKNYRAQRVVPSAILSECETHTTLRYVLLHLFDRGNKKKIAKTGYNYNEFSQTSRARADLYLQKSA